ncbi:hypothetical protein [Bermanella sp. R86510]|uniref:hypothetical protein n=1 Tax=unclassified Bermanella TaxID=2627862 RepID=UPI0037C68F82
MKPYLKILKNRTNSLSLRDRRTLAVGIGASVILLFIFLLWLPVVEDLFEINLNQKQQRKILDASKLAIEGLEARSKKDVNRPFKEKLLALKEQVSNQEKEIENLTSALVLPSKMSEVFYELLDDKFMQITQVNTLKAQPITLQEANTDEPILYKHEVILNLKGSFPSSVDYITALENEPWELYWDALEYRSDNYPDGILQLKVHTVSTSESVIGL